MKKKQLFAVLLAGSMTVGMAPAAAFAAEDTGAVTEAEAPTADENTETPDDGAAVDDQSQSEADAQAEAAAQAQAEAEAQAAAQAQAEAEAQAAAQAQAEAEAQAAEAQQEQTETVTGTTVTDEAGLAAAIAAAPDIDINNVNKDNLTTIVISGTVQITAPVTIPANKGILIVGKDDTSMIQRAAGFTGNLFDVSGALYMLDNSDNTLVVDGGSVNGVQAAGSLIHVASGAKFSMSTGITLTNNKVVADATTADTTAVAIFNEGGIVHISGGKIENNSSDKGAVYSTGKVFIEKIENTAETEPVITNNTKADGTTPANIILAGEGQLVVNSAIADPQIGFSVENAEERVLNSSAVIVKGEDCPDSDYPQALSVLAGKYEDVNYKVNPENGQLVSNKPVVTVTAKSEKANTVTASIKSDKAGTYYYKCVAKNTEAPTIGEAIKGEKVEAEKAVSLNLTDVKDTSIDLYVWVIADDGSVGEAEKQTIDVTQPQKPDDPKPAAPTVEKIRAESKTATTAEVVLQSDKSGTCYYKWVAKGAKKPSISTSKDSKIEITENKDFKIDLKNLKGDAIDLYVQVVAKDGSKTAVTKIATVTLKKETAKTPAKISNISYKWINYKSVTVTMRSDKAGVYYYKWVNRGSKAPTIDKMSKGIDVFANRDFTINLQNLDTDNAVDVYVSIKGTDGTVSTPKKIALDVDKRPADVNWIGFSWSNHTTANVTLRSNMSGTCYYKWVTRDKNGKSKTPDDLVSNGTQTAIIADKKFDIRIEDLNSDNPIDLYVAIKNKKGVLTIKRLKFEEDGRPKVATPTPTNTPNAYIPDVKESIVQGLDEAIQFYPNQFYEFTVIGAGTTNQDPNEGDVKWVPVYWSTAANPTQSQMHTAWKIGSAKGINKDATYNLYVFFQKYVYTGGQWQQTDTIESAVYQFKSAKLTPTGTPGADGSYGGGQTGSDPNATITGEASATSSNGGNGTRSRNAVSTADNSPVGTMSALAVASLLAGGYVIVRRRKKDI
ncbi:hypothetical protein [Blautia massiliensis (ex Durand et al. 2017)]|uniref:hypothetical protein n=1 Tax=Blautia massiliensis (ex Durand et al. 2017) TaxID=1737424 RepID=UPI0022E55687|nr:hypothetical protein [Blautia massiliensis (ex Durand et al. 2017)]